METPEQEKEPLLGYTLNALDDQEAIQVERELSRQPHRRSESATLQRDVTPLNDIAGFFEPPPQLAQRTCTKIWETLDKEGEEKNEILNKPATVDSVLGFIHDPFKTVVAMPVVEPIIPNVSEKVKTSHAGVPKSTSKSSHWIGSHRIGLVTSVSVGIVVAFFVFPMMRYAERSTRSYVTGNWMSEIHRQVDQYEQIHVNRSNVPRIEELLPFNLALHGWQELYSTPPSGPTKYSLASIIQAGGEPHPPNDVVRGQQLIFLTDFGGLNEPIPLDMSGMSDHILLSMPGQESSVRSALGQDILFKEGRVFFRILPGTEPPKK